MKVSELQSLANVIASAEQDQYVGALHILRAAVAAGEVVLEPEEARKRFATIFPRDEEQLKAQSAATTEFPTTPRVQRYLGEVSSDHGAADAFLPAVIKDPESEVAHFLDLAHATAARTETDEIRLAFTFPAERTTLDPKTGTLTTTAVDREAILAAEEAKYGL